MSDNEVKRLQKPGSDSKILSIRLQKKLLVQLENQARIQKLTLSDFVRQELSQVEKRIRDNELLKNKIVILLRQIYGSIIELSKNKVDLFKFEEIQEHSEKATRELEEAKGKVSSLLKANENMKELLDHKDYILRKYEPEKEVEQRVEKSEQVEDNDFEREESEKEVSFENQEELPPGDQAEDDGN